MSDIAYTTFSADPIFIAFNITTAIITWKNFYSLIPAVVSSMATISFWQKDVRYARKIAIINNVLMFIYDIFVTSYAGMIAEALAFISVLTAMIRN